MVGEVAQFLSRARVELTELQRDQESYAEIQQKVLAEKEELVNRVSALDATAAAAEERLCSQEALIARLQLDLTAARQAPRSEEQVDERLQQTEGRLGEALAKVQALEQVVQRERQTRAAHISQIRQEEVTHHSTEIALLKTRLASLEQQLETERERRVRLMEVVKSHEVIVHRHELRQRETAT